MTDRHHVTAEPGGSVQGLRTVNVGFIPLVDCASLVVAAEHGFAEAEGLDLVLVREASWASIRDHLNLGYLDAAHMLAGMPIAATLGIGHVRVPTYAPFSLGLNGNAITVGTDLHARMLDTGAMTKIDDPVGAGAALKQVVDAGLKAGAEPLTFGMVFPFSCHNYELRYWMASAGIDPDRDVRLVVVPPPLMVKSLRAGLVQGFCVGEPWNSLAVDAGAGRIVVTKRALWQLGPEKVLGVTATWVDANLDVLFALIRALHAAATWADEARNRPQVARFLATPQHLDMPPDIIERALTGRMRFGPDTEPQNIDDFLVLNRQAATFPWVSHALWIYSQMRRWGQAPAQAADIETVRQVFRPDLYRSALGEGAVALPLNDTKLEGAFPWSGQLETGHGLMAFGPDRFFDGQTFDPKNLTGYLAKLEMRHQHARLIRTSGNAG